MQEKGIEVSKRDLTEEDNHQDGCDENGDEKTNHGCASRGREITWLILNLVLWWKQENSKGKEVGWGLTAIQKHDKYSFVFCLIPHAFMAGVAQW